MILYYVIYIPLILWLIFDFINHRYILSNNYIGFNKAVSQRNIKGNMFIFVSFFIFFVLFLGLRGLTGSDTPVYKMYFDSNYYPVGFEKGYQILSQMFESSGYSFTSFQILIAILTIIPLFITFYKNSPSLSITVFMFYTFATILYAINISRQMVAVSFTFAAIMLFYKKGMKPKLLSLSLFIIAVLFHKTTLIAIAGLIPVYLVYAFMKKYKNINYFLGSFLVIGIIIFYKSNSFYNFMLSLANTGSLANYTSFVTTSSAEYNLVSKNLPTLLMTIIQALIFFMPSLKGDNLDDKTKFLLSIFFFLTFTQSFQVSWITERLTQYYIPFTSVLVARLICLRSKDRYYLIENIFIFLIFFMAGFIWFHRMVIHNFGTIYPYIGI